MSRLQSNSSTSSSADHAMGGASIIIKEPLEYEVLYYERKNKVHKSRGVSKLDGILSVTVATGAIRLRDATCTAVDNDSDGSSDDDEEEDQKMRGKAKKKKMQKQQRNKSKPVPYNGCDKSLAQKCCDLSDDDIIVLGSYEVQIVSCLSSKEKSQNNPNTAQKPLQRHLSSHGVATASTSSTAVNGLTRKRPNSLVSKKNTAAIGIGQRRIVSKPLQSSSKLQASTNNGHGRTVLKATTNIAPPPAQKPIRKPLLQSKHPMQAQRMTSTAARPLQSRARGVGNLVQRKQANPPRQPSQTNSNNNCTSGNGGNAVVVCPEIPMPPSLRTVLRPHQVQGVDFLWKALTEGPRKGAILADEMGLGKTLMTIAVICGLFRKQRDKHFIVVCPSSLVSNWAKEFDKWIGKTSQPKRVVIQKGDADNISRLKSVYSSTKSMGGQVLILSYELFRRVTDHFTHNISLLCVDEGHRLKNQDGLTVNALEALPCEAKLCITATPVQNNLREFYNLANFVRPGVLGELADFRTKYERPISVMNRKNATREQKLRGKEQAKELDTLIKPFMLRRLQKDVLKTMLPPRTEVLLFCKPTPIQCQMYEKLCRNATSMGMSTEALTTLTNLRKLCSHPFLVSQKNRNNTDNFPANGDDYASLSGKLIVLQSLLFSIRVQGDKVVIVSNFTSALSLIESAILQPQKLPFCRLDGSTDQSDRQSLVDSFNRPNSSVFAFLLSSKAGGCGLNLIGANRLVMYDADWNPATDAQATARIYRPGQTKPCHIYRMFTTGTVEEVILQRQIAKGSLAVFDGTKSNEKFTKEELADCFTLKDCKCDTKRKLGKTWEDYDGPDSLETQGSDDGTLRHIAEHKSSCNVLSFVHIVREKEDEVVGSPTAKSGIMDDMVNDESEEEAGSGDDESSDDEELVFGCRLRPMKRSFVDDEATGGSDEEDSSEVESQKPPRKRLAERTFVDDNESSDDEEMEF